jgi:hypothetical protein
MLVVILLNYFVMLRLVLATLQLIIIASVVIFERLKRCI